MAEQPKTATGYRVWFRACWRDDWQPLGDAESRAAAGEMIAAKIAAGVDQAEVRLTPTVGEFVVAHRVDRHAPWSEAGRFATRAEAAAFVGDSEQRGDYAVHFTSDVPSLQP